MLCTGSRMLMPWTHSERPSRTRPCSCSSKIVSLHSALDCMQLSRWLCSVCLLGTAASQRAHSYIALATQSAFPVHSGGIQFTHRPPTTTTTCGHEVGLITDLYSHTIRPQMTALVPGPEHPSSATSTTTLHALFSQQAHCTASAEHPSWTGSPGHPSAVGACLCISRIRFLS